MAMDKEERYMALSSQRSGVLRPIIASLQVKTYWSLLPHSGELFRLRGETLTLRYLHSRGHQYLSDISIKNCSQVQVAEQLSDVYTSLDLFKALNIIIT